VGNTFILDSGPNFDFAVSRMTDGLNNGGGDFASWDPQLYGNEWDFWHFVPQSNFYAIYSPYYGGMNGIDFQGYEITKLTMDINAWTSIHNFSDLTFSVYGNFDYEPPPWDQTVIPVHSAVILGSIGLFFAGWKLRKQRES